MPRRKDKHDYTAEQLMDEYVQNPDDEAMVERIADALREAAGVSKPLNLTREEYDKERAAAKGAK